MRYVLVLLGIFSLNDVASAMSARAGLLEIRSMPVVSNKLMRRLLRDEAKNAKVSNEDRRRKDRKIAHTSLALFTAVPLVSLTLGITGHMTGVIDENTAAAISLPGVSLWVTGVIGVLTGGEAYFAFEKERANKLIGKHVYYTQIRDGRAVLMRGIAKEYNTETGNMFVNTADGGEAIKIKDITASIPDHSDLHRRVSLITSDDYANDLYHLGQVSIVYNDGNYEIEIDRKVDLNNVEHPVDEPFTIFVHASLPRQEGGFTFIDDQASKYENVYEHPYTNNSLYDELIAAARQGDTPRDSRELEQTVVPESN